MSSGDSLMDSPVVPCASMDGTEPRELNPCSQGHTASVRVSELGSEPRVSGSQLPRCAARGAGGVGWGGVGGVTLLPPDSSALKGTPSHLVLAQ